MINLGMVRPSALAMPCCIEKSQVPAGVIVLLQLLSFVASELSALASTWLLPAPELWMVVMQNV
jgi:hypothetical protein